MYRKAKTRMKLEEHYSHQPHINNIEDCLIQVSENHQNMQSIHVKISQTESIPTREKSSLVKT